MNFDTMSWIEVIYWISTILGGTIFIFRMVLMFLAGDIDLGDAEGAMHADIDGIDFDVEADMGHTSSDIDFKFLSLQGISAFFMMFGLVGLAMHSAEIWVGFTILGGAAAGIFTVWVISLLFSIMKRLQSEGTIRLVNAIGQSGKVYLKIPENGSGQVQVVVQGSLKIFDAVAADKSLISTGENVKVVDVIGESTLIVEKI